MSPEEFKAARETLGFSQPEMAKMLGVSQAMTISNWERGVRSLNPMAVRLTQALLDGWRPKEEKTE